MVAWSPKQWKDFYAAERDRLGPAGLARLIDAAPAVPFPPRGAMIFPHTCLAATGHMTATVAKAAVLCQTKTVIAIGVLHGIARGSPTDHVGLHTADDPLVANEFSLDNFKALLATAAEHLHQPMPTLIERYPLLPLPDRDPTALPGLADLRAQLDAGAIVVSTTDPIHHGIGYDTPAADLRDDADPATAAWARATVMRTLDHLCRGDWPAFTQACAADRSDFRDAGPAVAALLGASPDTPLSNNLIDLTLVNYANVLQVMRPTWVCGSLLTLSPSD